MGLSEGGNLSNRVIDSSVIQINRQRRVVERFIINPRVFVA